MSLFKWEWPIEQAKAVLIAHLKSLGFSSVSIGYDGTGDEGGITDIELVDAHGQTTPLPMFGRADNPLGTLADALEEFTWKVLDEHQSGFEIDDGAFGAVILNVSDAKLTIQHNARFTDYHSSTVEV